MKYIILLLLALGIVCAMTGCGAAAPEPAPTEPDDIFMFDGDRSYMANDVMLPLMVGAWESGDGRYAMTYDESCNVAISLDGSCVLNTVGEFTHLEPGGPDYTELRLAHAALTDGDGAVLAEIAALGFDPAEGEGCMVLQLYDGKTAFSTEKILLHRCGGTAAPERN